LIGDIGRWKGLGMVGVFGEWEFKYSGKGAVNHYGSVVFGVCVTDMGNRRHVVGIFGWMG